MNGTGGISPAQPGGNDPQNVKKTGKSEGKMEGYTVTHQPDAPSEIEVSPLENTQNTPMEETEKDHSFTQVDREELEQQRGGGKDPALQTDAIKQKILVKVPNTDEAQQGIDNKRGDTSTRDSEDEGLSSGGAVDTNYEPSSDGAVDTNYEAAEMEDLDGGFEMLGDIMDALGIDAADKEDLQVKKSTSENLTDVQKSLKENPKDLDVIFKTPEGNIERVPATEVLKDPQKFNTLKIMGIYNREEKTVTLVGSKHQQIFFDLFVEHKAKSSEAEENFVKEDDHNFSAGYKVNHPTTPDSDNKNIQSKKEAGDKFREKADILDRQIQKNSLEKEATDKINLKKHLKNQTEKKFDQKQEGIKKSEIQKRKKRPPPK